MENRTVPALIALAGVLIAIAVYFFVLNDDTADGPTETSPSAQTGQAEPPGPQGGSGKPDEPEEPEVPLIEIADGEPVGGVKEIEITEGEEIRIQVKTDAPDELHLHTYDVYLDVAPGKPAELVVPRADIGGVVELESHTTGVPIAEISVVPG